MEILVLTLVKTHNYCYINYTILPRAFFHKKRTILPIDFSGEIPKLSTSTSESQTYSPI